LPKTKVELRRLLGEKEGGQMLIWIVSATTMFVALGFIATELGLHRWH
jgi:hypothetical protein